MRATALSVMLACGLGYLPLQAHAARFTDTFESGTLRTNQTPPGQWDDVFVNDGANSSLQTAQAAAHRGTEGLRLIDGSGQPGNRIEAQAERALPANASYYLRYWFRLTQSNGQGSAFLSQLCSGTCSEGYGDLVLRMDTRRLQIAGADVSGQYTFTDSSRTLSSNTWHLLELAVTGLGTSTGARRVWIDGQAAGQLTDIDFTGRAVGQLVLGQPWTNDGLFEGTLDFDDVYADVAPLPSHYALSVAAGTWQVNDCIAVTVALRDSVSHALAPAPYVVVTELSVSGVNGAFFSNPACSNPLTTVSVLQGTSNATAYFKPSSAGTATVRASNGDFFAGTITLNVSTTLSPQGAECSVNSQCASGFCAEGVCCNTACNGGGCEACSLAKGASAEGTCTLLSATVVCRPAVDVCDVAESCNGGSASCPGDDFAVQGTVCREPENETDAPEVCSGGVAACPAEGAAPEVSETPGSPADIDEGQVGCGCSADGGALSVGMLLVALGLTGTRARRRRAPRPWPRPTSRPLHPFASRRRCG